MRTNRNKYFSIPKTRRGDLLAYWEGGESGHWVICSMQGVVLEYADDAELHWRGHTLRFVALPGHTPGSAGIFLDENTFFCGDYLIPEEEPILRFPGGDAEAYERITRPFLDSLPKGILICPGHREKYILE